MSEEKEGSIIVHWDFSKENVLFGTIEEKNLIIKDLSGNENNLDLVIKGDLERVEDYLNWSADESYLKFNNKLGLAKGIYFKTSEKAMVNNLNFIKGYTIEVILEIKKRDFNPWMGILTRDGSGKELNKVKGESEILTTLSYNDIFQWTGYPLNLDYNPTNWSISPSSDNGRDGFHHLSIVNDGKNTTLYLNGIADIRNPKEEIRGIDFVLGKGWLVGAAKWNNKISSLFKGNLKAIRISNKALEKEQWLIKKHKPTVNLLGSNEKKIMLKNKKNYNLVVVPDSQYMGDAEPKIVETMMKWVADNKEELNIEMLLHVGDITEEASEREFIEADKHFKILEEKNINYMVTIGNHDYSDGGINFRKYFSSERFKFKKGFNKNSIDDLNMYSILNIGSFEYLFISLDYKVIDYSIEWARKIIKKNKDKDKAVIIFTHDCYDIEKEGMKRTKNGEKIWNELVVCEDSIFMVIAGHEFGVRNRISKNINNKEVIELLVNYQCYPSGGNGWLRLIEIDEENGLYFKTFSPWVKSKKENERTPYDLEYLTSKNDEFHLNINLKKRFR